jgi:hypothetical protein
VGGAWTTNEIIRLYDPTVPEILAELIDVRDADYAFVSFSGHGNHYGQNPLNTRLLMCDGQTMRPRDLDPGNGKCTILIDACRQLVHVSVDWRDYVIENRRVASRVANREDYRLAFDNAVDNAPDQTVYMFSCAIGQNAADGGSRGGVFTRGLVSQAIEWDRNGGRVQLTQRSLQAFLRARAAAQLTSDQEPQIHRTINQGFYLPFAVYIPGELLLHG